MRVDPVKWRSLSQLSGALNGVAPPPGVDNKQLPVPTAHSAFRILQLKRPLLSKSLVTPFAMKPTRVLSIGLLALAAFTGPSLAQEAASTAPSLAPLEAVIVAEAATASGVSAPAPAPALETSSSSAGTARKSDSLHEGHDSYKYKKDDYDDGYGYNDYAKKHMKKKKDYGYGYDEYNDYDGYNDYGYGGYGYYPSSHGKYGGGYGKNDGYGKFDGYGKYDAYGKYDVYGQYSGVYGGYPYGYGGYNGGYDGYGYYPYGYGGYGYSFGGKYPSSYSYKGVFDYHY